MSWFRRRETNTHPLAVNDTPIPCRVEVDTSIGTLTNTPEPGATLHHMKVVFSRKGDPELILPANAQVRAYDQNNKLIRLTMLPGTAILVGKTDTLVITLDLAHSVHEKWFA